MLSAASSAWDTKALTGSVIGGRYRLERSLAANEQASGMDPLRFLAR
jgi:hypothetical protein